MLSLQYVMRGPLPSTSLPLEEGGWHWTVPLLTPLIRSWHSPDLTRMLTSIEPSRDQEDGIATTTRSLLICIAKCEVLS